MSYFDKRWSPMYSEVLSEYTDENGDVVHTCMDKNTGEIVDYVISKGITRDISYPPPIDISLLNSRDIFEKITDQKIGKKRYQLWVGNMLLDLVVDKKYHPSVFGMFCYLGQNVKYNNLIYTSTKEMSVGAGYNRDTVSKAVKKLKEEGLLREVDNKLEHPTDRLFMINPLYFFLGYYPYRSVLIKDWY